MCGLDKRIYKALETFPSKKGKNLYGRNKSTEDAWLTLIRKKCQKPE